MVDNIDFNKLEGCHLVKLEIEQFFTDLNDKSNTMVRKTAKNGDVSYCKTIKKDTDKTNERITTSRNITEKEYYELLGESSDKIIRKVRYCFTYKNQYYRLDVFNEPNGLIVLETELTNESKKLEIPEFLSVIEDISNDINYRNVCIYTELNQSYKRVLNK